MGQRVDITALYPELPGEDAIKWTGRLLSHAREHGTNRQCSIGYHGECSDRSGDTCQCLCHDDATRWFTVEGHVEGGVFTITRAEQGKQSWPPVEGEPASVWAHWIMGTSEQDAKARAVNKEAARLGLEPVKAEHMAAVPGMEPVKPGPEVALAEKVAALALAARDNKARWKGGILGDHHLTEVLEQQELELTEAWREYVHSLE